MKKLGMLLMALILLTPALQAQIQHIEMRVEGMT